MWIDAVMDAHRFLSAVMRSNNDIDWPVHSLMLSFHDLRGLPLRHLPSTVPIEYNLRQRIMTTDMTEP